MSFIRDDTSGRVLRHTGERSWLRVTETWTPTAKSVFGFGVNGEVATSTHAGLPWLLYLRSSANAPSTSGRSTEEIPLGNSVVAEVYPALWMRRFPRNDRDSGILIEDRGQSSFAWLASACRI